VKREAAGTVAIAVVCVFAVVFAAATLDDAEPAPGAGVGSGGGSGVGSSDVSGSIDLQGQNRSGIFDLGEEGRLFPEERCVKPLQSPLISWGALLGLLAVGGFVYHRDGALPAFAVVTVLLMPMVGVKLLLSACPEDIDAENGVPEPLSNQSGAGGGTGSPSGGSQLVPVDVPVFVYVLVGAGLLMLITFVIGTKEDVVINRVPDVFTRQGSEVADEEDVNTGALGRAAGRAADRIETGTGADNEVYRAWVEMTRHLDVDHPESSTAAEFAAAAVDAGLDPDDVDELTRQFEAVRYGGDEPTTERERRAIEALRRIEAEYADDGGAGT
jgi:hypothetical protein